ncbi:MAG TPA: helix-turn-helix domain-containing protein, partial [Pseudonocardia sp.]
PATEDHPAPMIMLNTRYVDPGEEHVSEQRRSPAELRELILAAATELFATQGFARTSHRDIAQRAGTAESVIFRKFRTKAELFNAAVLDPFKQQFEEFSERWRAQLDDRVADEQIFRLFIEGLYDLVLEHRGLLLALMAATQFGAEDGIEEDFGFVDLLEREEEIFRIEAESRGWPDFDIAMATRSTVSAIMAMGLLDPWLYRRDGARPNRDDAVDELVALCYHGVVDRTPRARSQHRTRKPVEKPRAAG